MELSANISQSAWLSAPNGDITIRFYAQDKAGNIGETNIIIIKNTPSERKPKISGYNIIILIGVSSVIMVFLVNQRHT